MSGIKTMTVEEFWRLGYLQEVNRRFLHPLGLALSVEADEGGASFGPIWDCRDDPEGLIFSLNEQHEAECWEKALRVSAEEDQRRMARVGLLGYWIQPLAKFFRP